MKAMREKYEWPTRQPEPIPTLPPSGKLILFPRKEVKKEHKVPSMGCCKTQMMDWDFTSSLF